MSEILEISNGAIHPQLYDRVVATSQAELLAFSPEIVHVQGFVRGSSERWWWDGLTWNRVGVSYAQPTAPEANESNIGKLWLDSCGTIWICNGLSWDLYLTPDVGEQTILTDETGAVLVDENYSLLVEA